MEKHTDRETREFIESQNKALLEDVVEVIRDMGDVLGSRIGRVEAELVGVKTDVAMLKTDVADLKDETALHSQILLRLEHGFKGEIGGAG
jgi:hypothetical protein